MQRSRKRHRPRVLKPSLRADDSGIALIYVTIALPVIIGFALLAIDVGRFSALNSSLQHGADSLAIAGAAELDGSPTSITRSEDAMKQFVTQNTALFTSSTAAIKWADVTTCYLSSLPASDATPISNASCLSTADSNSPFLAKFVRVVVQPKSYTTIFPVSILGTLSNTTQTAAEAVAGFQAVACNFTPLYMCNPFEPTTGPTNSFDDYGLIAASKDPNQRKAAIKLIEAASSGTATGVPGQFGYLDPSTGNGAKSLGEEIASTRPEACFIINNLSTVKTGGMTSLVKAFNTRFDIYGGPYSKNDYPSAINVRKGWDLKGASCSGELSTDTSKFMAMPVDSCFKTSTCASGNRGNGDWKWEPELSKDVSFLDYWNVNFNYGGGSSGKAAPSPSALNLGTRTTSYTGAVAGSGFDTPPRYDVYLYENSTSLPGNKYLYEAKSKGGEVGNPQCSAGISNPDRRLIYGAVINCRAQGLQPGNGGYTAFAFAKFFIIRPMSEPPDVVLWTELVDVVRPGDGTGVARDKVQLYR